MIAADVPVAPVSAVVIPSDFGNWEGKLNCGWVNPDRICPTPPSSGQPTTPSASPTTSTLIGQELADVSAVNELLADPRLDVFAADPSEGQPYHR